ncbi:MAG: amino acid ABC transporter ATP-binding protein [Terrimesophilobacter sp.]
MSHAEDARAPAGLSVSGLSKSFGGHRVLDGISFEVATGSVVVIIGPSGSGKTTILRSLNALETPDAGTVRIGTDVAVDFSAPVGKGEIAALRRKSAMVFQHYNLFPHKTVLQNITEGPVQVQKRPFAQVQAEALELLRKVGLEEKRDVYPFELSGGQQQRVGIARALAIRPEILLFDEATSALDPELVGDVLGVMKDLAQEGWTMVVVTHELEFARRVADQVLFLDDGAIVERGRPQAIFTDPQEPRTQKFLSRLLHPLD